MTDVHQYARDAAAKVAYEHVGVNCRTVKDGWPAPLAGLIPAPRKPRELAYTMVDAARTIGADTDRDPGTWEAIMEHRDWAEHGACKGQTSFFFPNHKGPVDAQIRICAGCPVRVECLTFAINNYEQFGVWGGVSGEQRGEVRGRVHRGEPARPLPPTYPGRRRRAS